MDTEITELVEQIQSNKIWKGHLHLPHDDKTVEKIEKLFNKNISRYCVCREGSLDGNVKPHYHFFCFLDESAIKLSSFKKNIITMFPQLKREGQGGEHKYSCVYPKITQSSQYKNYLSKDEQLADQLFYCCKEWNPIENIPITKNFNKEELYHKYYYDLKTRNNELKTEEDKKNTKDKKNYVRDLEEQIIKLKTKKGADGVPYFQKPTLEELISIVCDHFSKTRKTMNKNVIQNLVETLQNIFCPIFYEQYKEDIKNKILG